MITIPVFAATYSATFTVTETSGIAYTMLPVIKGSPNTWMADNGFMKTTALDTRVETMGGIDKPIMVADNQTLTAIPVPLSSQTNLYFTTGNSDMTTMQVITGYNGYLTVGDSANLEWGNSGNTSITGYFDPTSTGNLFTKGVDITGFGNGDGTVSAGFGQSPSHLQQIISGGNNDPLNAAATEYNGVMGAGLWNATESVNYQVIPTGGSIDRLYIRLSANVAAGATYTFTLMKNAGTSTLTVTIAAGASTGSDLTHSVALVAGDLVSIRSTYTGSPGTPFACWSTRWMSTLPNESICMANGFCDTAFTYYASVQGNNSVVTTETQISSPIPSNSTCSKLYVNLSIRPGAAPDDVNVTLYKNGVATTLTATITDPATTGHDTINSVSFTAGDLASWRFLPENTLANTPNVAVSMVWASDIVGESMICGAAPAPSAAANQYEILQGGSASLAWNSTEANTYQVIQKTILSKFYVKTFAAPDNGAGVQSYQFDIRYAAGNTGISVLISEASTTGSDLVNTYTTADGGLTSIKSTPVNTPSSVNRTRWGLVSRVIGVYVTTPVISAGLHTFTPFIYGGNWGIKVDSGAAVTTAYSGSIVDNASPWVFCNSNIMPYVNEIRQYISGVQQLYYAPVDMIRGRTYSTGTVTVTNGDATVTGAGGATWASTQNGSMFKSADGIYYRVASITSNTTLELSTVYAGGTLAGQTYNMYPRMPDRSADATENHGAITWGTNPVGVSISLGPLTGESSAPGFVEEPDTADVLGSGGSSDLFVAPDLSVGGSLLTNPFRPFVLLLSDTTTLTERQAWVLLGIAFVLLVLVITAKTVRGHHILTGIATGGAICVCVVMTIFPLYAIIFIIASIFVGAVAERSPSL
jgi:hypothetical protein